MAGKARPWAYLTGRLWLGFHSLVLRENSTPEGGFERGTGMKTTSRPLFHPLSV